MCLPQGGFCWSQKVQVPMYSDAMNILSCLWVCQHLYRERKGLLGKESHRAWVLHKGFWKRH